MANGGIAAARDAPLGCSRCGVLAWRSSSYPSARRSRTPALGHTITSIAPTTCELLADDEVPLSIFHDALAMYKVVEVKTAIDIYWEKVEAVEPSRTPVYQGQVMLNKMALALDDMYKQDLPLKGIKYLMQSDKADARAIGVVTTAAFEIGTLRMVPLTTVMSWRTAGDKVSCVWTPNTLKDGDDEKKVRGRSA